MITCLDAGPAQDYPLERFKGLTILSPNETETEALVGILPKDDETCIAASKILKERSDCKYVVLKMGDKGSFIYGDDICQMVPTFKVEAGAVRPRRPFPCTRILEGFLSISTPILRKQSIVERQSAPSRK